MLRYSVKQCLQQYITQQYNSIYIHRSREGLIANHRIVLQSLNLLKKESLWNLLEMDQYAIVTLGNAVSSVHSLWRMTKITEEFFVMAASESSE